MDVPIPPELVPYVKTLIQSGRCRNEEEVIQDALLLLQECEERRKQLKQDVHEEVNSGASVPGEEVFARLEARAEKFTA